MDPASSVVDTSSYTQMIAELFLNQEVVDWRAKWQHACELLWDALSANPEHIIFPNTLKAFILLLSDDDRFAIARLVIPELRDTTMSADHPQQRQILDAVYARRNVVRGMEQAKQRDFDRVQYAVEKRIMLEAEIHRTRVLLHQSEAFGTDKDREIEEWLAKRPKTEGM